MQEISGLDREAAKSHILLSLVGLMQIADDVLDWKDDQDVQCPSYVTVLLLDQPKNKIAIPLRAQADALLRELFDAAKQDAAALPFGVAGALTWSIIVVLIKLRFPR